MNASSSHLDTRSIPAAADTSAARTTAGLLPLFFLSGIAALIYQICWQRLLFVAFGVDIESVTIIVSTFMFGLGAGALVGGELADRFPNRTLSFFALIELAIGAFGLLSPALIHAAGSMAVRASLPVIAMINFLLLLCPTVMMGATLPILVAHIVRTHKSVGVSIGLLYFINTLGAAFGAAATGFLAFYYIGITATIYVAAALNALVSAAVWFGLRKISC
jgi:predicted membrane-bound spermidine synthase